MGSEKTRIIIMLSVLTNGWKLPPYVILWRKTMPRDKLLACLSFGVWKNAGWSMISRWTELMLEPYTNTYIMLRCYDYRWPVLNPLISFLWGWYYWAEKVKVRGRGRGDWEACLRHWESYEEHSQVRRRPVR
jgi:hypothetical protein